MKTKNSVLPGLTARLARAGLRIAATMAVVAFFATNLSAATTVAWITGGPTPGYEDGDLATEAYFNTPSGLAIDPSGDFLYIADRNNNAVRGIQFSINTAGTLLTYTNYVQANNLFSQPIGVALDPNYNLFVLCRGTGKNGYILSFDYTGELLATNLSSITNAGGIALDNNDDIFVTASNKVFEIFSPSGVVTNLATITATNCSLQGIVYRHNGMLAVCDTGRNGILQINPNTGVVTTNAGFHGAGDFVSLNNTAYSNVATFYQPSGIAESGDGTLIVTDYGNDRVKAVLANGNVTNVYGIASKYWTGNYPGFQDGTVALPDNYGGVAGREENGVVVAPDGSLYVSEDYYHIIRKVTGAGFIPEPVQPTAPAGLTAVVSTNSQGLVDVVLNWNPVANSGVTNYLVERSPSTGGPYQTVGQTSATTFTDTSVGAGETYFYVVQAATSTGLSGDSAEVSVTIPNVPPPPPTIGWFDYEFNQGDLLYLSTFHPLTNGIYTTYNDLDFAIEDDAPTLYISGPTPLSSSPTNGSAAFTYVNGVTIPQNPAQGLPITTFSNLTIKAVSENAGLFSAISTAQIIYECGPPIIIGTTNAAQFFLDDVTTNVVYFYTTDGSDPLTNMITSQEIISTNGLMQMNLNITSNFVFSVRAFRGGYLPSGLVTNIFLGQNFQANQLTWGFSSGYASSSFIASPGEWFYAPVTLTTLPDAVIYGMGFDMYVTNLGVHPVPPGALTFSSMLYQPLPTSNTESTIYYPIPPLAFVGDYVGTPPSTNIVYYNGTNFVNMTQVQTNINEMAVAWVEMGGKTNLYNTASQDLIKYSIAFIQMLPSGSQPNDVIVGGYAFQVPTNATPGEQYQITLQNPSANDNGIGGNGSAVIMQTPTDGALGIGAMNSIKVVTVGQPKYLAGDVYPFQWFNAGNFGNGDLGQYWFNDVLEVFNAAIYDINAPPANSDLFDAMDSAGGFGALDGASGYWTNSNQTLDSAQRASLFNANDVTNMNQMAFGDGVLDICDVYTTFLRANFSDAYWFQRFYTNDTVNGVYGRVAMAITTHTNVGGGVFSPAGSPGGGSPGGGNSQSPSSSITNTPTVHFAVGDYMASPSQAGHTIQIPVTATVYGPYPLNMLMLNVFVTPLDGTPPLATPVTFSANTPFSNSSIYNSGIGTNSVANCAEAFMPVTYPISSSANITGSNIVGWVNITIPANVTSQSAYSLSFAHASASPNGLISFPKTACTGLLTFSSRTNSTYNDGIPDSWRLRYFGTIYNQLSVSNADADGTGLNNWQKYSAGLNPIDPTSVLNEGTDQTMAQSPQDMVLYWPSVNGQSYTIKRSSTLFPPQWTIISTNIGNGTYMEIHDTNGGPNRYYEVTTP